LARVQLSRGSYTGHRDDLAAAIDRVWEEAQPGSDEVAR